MKKYYPLGRVFGIEIGLHYSWFFIFALLAFGLSTDYFPQQVEGLTQMQYYLAGSVSALMLFVSVLLHEMSHSLVAKYFKLPVHGISLFFFGGVSQIPDEHITPKVEILMASAGPAFSILFAFICAIFTSVPNAIISAMFYYLTYINLLLGIFNMMPAFPLDGGRVLRSIIWYQSKNLEFATYVASKSGKFFAALLIILGITGIFMGNPGTFWFILLGGFIYLMAETSFEQVMIRKSLDKVLVKDLMVKPKGFSPDESVHAIVHSKILHNIHDAYPVIEKGKFLGVLKRAMVQKIKPQLRKDMTVKKLITKPPFKVKPKDKIYPLLTKMVQSNAPLVPVYQGKVFKGILRREDIVEYIRMNA